jgi:hypothetical protein
MKTLLLLLLAVPAFAQDVTTHLLLPSYGGSNFVHYQTTSMICWRVPARLGITNATKVAGAAPVTGGSGCVAGFAIYADDDAGARLGYATGNCTLDAIISNAANPAFSLVQGTTYRLCTCSNHTGAWYLGVWETSVPNTPVLVGTTKAELLNNVTTHAGLAATACAVGVPPLTTGALSTPSYLDQLIPLILVEN